MRHLAPLVLCAAASISPMAFADKLSDFRDADRSDEGCVTIPVTRVAFMTRCRSVRASNYRALPLHRTVETNHPARLQMQRGLERELAPARSLVG
jgi:hypothetical protein